MASITLSELKAVRPAYANLPKDKKPENPTGQCAYRKYEFEEAAMFPIYEVHALSDKEIIAFYAKVSDKQFNKMTEEDFFTFVSIALNIKNPINREDRMLKLPYGEDKLCKDFKTAKPKKTNSVPFKTTDPILQSFSLVPATKLTTTDTPLNEASEDQADALCFYFAWLCRFCVKTPSAALNLTYDKVRDTYLKFYQKSSGIFDRFRPDVAWLLSLRNCFDSLPRVKNTVVLYTAAAETRLKGEPRQFNVLRYTLFQNLEFVGMHAYVSIVTITNKVSLSPDIVLTWLRMSGAEQALDEAYDIMHRLDNGMIEDGASSERLWKYARLLDPGYFNHLQTSYSAELVATLAYIEIMLGISNATGYASPLNTFAIAKNHSIKEIGKMKAEAFIECKNKMVALSADATVVDKMYAEKAQGMYNDPNYRAYKEQDMDQGEVPAKKGKKRNRKADESDEEEEPRTVRSKKVPPVFSTEIPDF